MPESLKIFLDPVIPDDYWVACEQIFQPIYLPVGKVFLSFQQVPVAFGQERFYSLTLQLVGSDGVDGLTHVTHDMKPIKDIGGTRGLCGK